MAKERKHTQSAGIVATFLSRLTSESCRRPRLVLAASIFLVALSIYLTCVQLKYKTDRKDLISTSSEHVRRWQAYEE